MDAVDRIFTLFHSQRDADRMDFSKMVIQQSDIQTICELAMNSFKKQPIVLKLSQPLVIVGDIHGNIHDLIRVINIFGISSNYIFLGDYVDRGQYSVLVTIYLFVLMLKFPNHVSILRGNHEFQSINRSYGFYDEIMILYNNEAIFNLFNTVFSFMPLAAILNRKIICVHGGISPQMSNISQLESIERPITNYTDNKIISDILWSDPTDLDVYFQENRRGLGVLFSPDAIKKFLEENKLKLLIRAHQCVRSGVNLFANFCGVTVFSSSKYNLNTDNKSGVIRFPNENEVQLISLDFSKSLVEQENACLFFSKGEIGLHVGDKKRISENELKTPKKSARRRSHSESPKKTTKSASKLKIPPLSNYQEAKLTTNSTKKKTNFVSDASMHDVKKNSENIIEKQTEASAKTKNGPTVHKRIVMKRRHTSVAKENPLEKQSLFEVELKKCISDGCLSSMSK